MTTDFDFHLSKGSKVRVPFMSSDNKQLVQEYNGFKVLALPYVHGNDKRRFTMYFFLPDEKDSLPSFIEKTSSESDFLERHIPRNEIEVERFLIPKFKILFGFEASDMLKELGVVVPFSEGLTEIVDSSFSENVAVLSIYHKSFVEVNEEGTEATAATTSYMTSSLSVKFVADHPFLFMIREDFMGQKNNPSVQSNDVVVIVLAHIKVALSSKSML